jgi:hypothetical protein
LLQDMVAENQRRSREMEASAERTKGQGATELKRIRGLFLAAPALCINQDGKYSTSASSGFTDTP